MHTLIYLFILFIFWSHKEKGHLFAIRQSFGPNSKDTLVEPFENAKQNPKKRRKKNDHEIFWIIKLLYMIQYTTRLPLWDFEMNTAKCIL